MFGTKLDASTVPSVLPTRTTTQISPPLFNNLAEVDAVHVPYKERSALNVDILTGRVDMTIASLVSVLKPPKVMLELLPVGDEDSLSHRTHVCQPQEGGHGRLLLVESRDITAVTDDAIDEAVQPLTVTVVMSAVDTEGLDVAQGGDVGRQFLQFRTWCALDKHREDTDIVVQRGPDLVPDIVTLVVEASPAHAVHG